VTAWLAPAEIVAAAAPPLASTSAVQAAKVSHDRLMIASM